MRNCRSYTGKSVFGLIFFFITVLAYGEEGYVLKLKPGDKDIEKRLSEFLALENIGGKVVEFSPGEYHFDRPLFLNSNTIFKGDSASNTILIFDLKGKGSCINVKGNREKNIVAVQLKYLSGLDKIGAEYENLYKVYNASPKNVELSKWGKESFGMVIKGNLIGDQLCITNKLYEVDKKVLGDSILCYELAYVSNVSIQNLTIERIDRSDDQTSNISLVYAKDCQIRNVISHYCNYSHVNVENSYGILVNHSKFQNAFDHGNGGKGYGVTLQYGASSCELSGCHFDSLRHGVVLQLGANHNFIVENYFSNGFWTEVSLPKRSTGDIVLHGNYPYLNFIQGNICNNIVIDNSHGLNGPSNLFEHNKTLLYGIFMNRKSVDGITYVLGNEIVKKGCFKGKLRFRRNLVESCGNKINNKSEKDIGACESASTNEHLREKIKRSINDATQYFGITVSEG